MSVSYFKIGAFGCSQYVSGLKISKLANYATQTNAAGNTVVDYINTKRTIEVTFRAVDDLEMSMIQTMLNQFNMTISYLDAITGALEEVNVIVPNNEIEYYTIQENNILYKAFTITFIEL